MQHVLLRELSGRYPTVGKYDLRIAVENINNRTESQDIYPIMKELSDIFFSIIEIGHEAQMRSVPCVCPFCDRVFSYSLRSYRTANNTFMCNFCFGDFGPICTFYMEYVMGTGVLRIFELVNLLQDALYQRTRTHIN